MAKVKVLDDVSISVDVPSYVLRFIRDPERRAKELESWVKEFNDFVRDHRSQDENLLTVERVYVDQCSFCHAEWEEDSDGRPVCCGKAIEEFEAKVLADGLLVPDAPPGN